MVIEHGWTPRKFENLPVGEKAFVIASIKSELEQRKKENDKIKSMKKR